MRAARYAVARRRPAVMVHSSDGVMACRRRAAAAALAQRHAVLPTQWCAFTLVACGESMRLEVRRKCKGPPARSAPGRSGSTLCRARCRGRSVPVARALADGHHHTACCVCTGWMALFCIRSGAAQGRGVWCLPFARVRESVFMGGVQRLHCGGVGGGVRGADGRTASRHAMQAVRVVVFVSPYSSTGGAREGRGRTEGEGGLGHWDA